MLGLRVCLKAKIFGLALAAQALGLAVPGLVPCGHNVLPSMTLSDP